MPDFRARTKGVLPPIGFFDLEASEIQATWQAMGDLLNEAYGHITSGQAQTYLATAASSWLDRWGQNLGILRHDGELDVTYRSRLLAAFSGNTVTRRAIKAVLNAAGLTFRLHESADDGFFLDQGYLNNDRFFSVAQPAIWVELLGLTSQQDSYLDQAYADQVYLAGTSISAEQAQVLQTLLAIKGAGIDLYVETPPGLIF